MLQILILLFWFDLIIKNYVQLYILMFFFLFLIIVLTHWIIYTFPFVDHDQLEIHSAIACI
jgi:uncharacterized protein (DUF58 family)